MKFKFVIYGVNCLKSSIRPSLPVISSPLQFITLYNGNKEYIALVDSGAQINVIGEALVKSLESPQCCESSITRLRAVDNSVVPIHEWITIRVVLANGDHYEVPFAVVRDVKTAMIVGLPFLKQTGGQIDHKRKTIYTKQGPIPLMSTLR